jgi:hypothetical protein
MKNVVFQALADAARAGESIVLGIISGVKGSSLQKVGAKALFYTVWQRLHSGSNSRFAQMRLKYCLRVKCPVHSQCDCPGQAQ